ncbi:proton-coupled amino acid transporter 2-like isoform X2 [Tachypleus tridentatus]|uniref:proton-coupled amino acid transporter 2-like isoform X2 n=1 Tax=Tachypleus tridentatus TaxID=6853 RepID=UPI003FCFFA43
MDMNNKSFDLVSAIGTGMEKLKQQQISSSVPRENSTEHIVLNHPRDSTTDIARTQSVEGPSKDVSTNTSQISNSKALMNLIKANVGPGLLAIPNAFGNAGLLVGTLGVLILGSCCIHCMHILVRCSNRLEAKTGTRNYDYAKLVEYAYRYGPEPLVKYTPLARQTVNVFLILTQYGFCCVYFIFMASSIQHLVIGHTDPEPQVFLKYLSAVLPVVVLFSYFRTLNHLGVISTFANIALLLGTCIVFVNLFQDRPDVRVRPLSVSITRFPLFFGTVMFTFEAIAVVLPIKADMRSPQDYGGYTGILSLGMVIVTVMYTAMGFYGYLKFGDQAQGSITLNLPTTRLYNSVQVMFLISIFVTYLLQFYVPFQFIWPYVKKTLRLEERVSCRTQLALEMLLRTLLVFITFSLAAFIPKLDLFIPVVGAVASSSLALIFPAVLEIIVFWDAPMSKTSWWVLSTKCLFIGVLGFVGFVTGAYQSILAIVSDFHGK